MSRLELYESSFCSFCLAFLTTAESFGSLFWLASLHVMMLLRIALLLLTSFFFFALAFIGWKLKQLCPRTDKTYPGFQNVVQALECCAVEVSYHVRWHADRLIAHRAANLVHRWLVERQRWLQLLRQLIIPNVKIWRVRIEIGNIRVTLYDDKVDKRLGRLFNN